MAIHHGRGRRRFLLVGGAAMASLAFGRRNGVIAQTLPLTPGCQEGGEPTPRQTEGPFYQPKSPERSTLVEPGMAGQPVEVFGSILDRNCRPVPRALIDVWQTDAKGEYDHRGFRLRGHIFSDAEGRYRILTVRPASYAGRTAHIHVKVQVPAGRILTTQLYFPDEPGNARDSLFRPELVMRLARQGDVLAAQFDFVLDTA